MTPFPLFPQLSNSFFLLLPAELTTLTWSSSQASFENDFSLLQKLMM